MKSRPNATLVERRDLHADLHLLCVAPDGGEYPPFEPGQYTSLGRVEPDGTLVRRTYSIASSAHRRDRLEFFVVHVDDGEFTTWLGRQREGARLWLAPRASGAFTLEGVSRGHDVVFVATGTGVSPYLSMIRTYRRDPRWRRCVLIHGVRRAADLGYRVELEALARDDERFVYLPTVTREPEGSDWTGLRGRVQEVLEPERFESLCGFAIDPRATHVFLCGNPAMVDDVEARLAARGFTHHRSRRPGTLHVEKYW